MFNTDIPSRNIFSENAYLALTSKYHKYYKSLAEKRSDLNFTFLYGPAGTGKTSILINEFLNRFMSEQYDCLTFSFIPDNPDHNNSLFKNIVIQLLQITCCNINSLSVLRSQIDEMDIEDTVKDAVLSMIFPIYKAPRIADKTLSEITACAFLLRYILNGRKACFIFDDIHLSEEIVRKLFHALEEHGASSISIVCTSRNSKIRHNFSLKSSNKWIHIDHLGDKDASKFGSHISASAPLETNIVLATNGNIYLIKELARLNDQKKKLSLKAPHASSYDLHFNPNNITHSILEKRCIFLTDQQKDLLRLCVALGFSFEENVLIKLYEYIYKISPAQEIYNLISDGFLCFKAEGAISFDHQITYDFFCSYFNRDDLVALHKKIFHYFRSVRRAGNDSSQLSKHALSGGLLTFSYIYYKKQARESMRTGQYINAACCYEQCLSIIDIVSSKRKNAQRLLPIYKDLLSAYLILWEHEKSKDVSRKLLLLSEQFSQIERLNIHSLITAIHWTIGDFPKALTSSCNVFETSKQIKFTHGIITAGVRCGSLQAEMGLYQECLKFYEETLSYISEDMRTEKFGLFVSAYPNITSVQSMCYAEMGMGEEYISSRNISVECLSEDVDDFTKLFITTHTGYAFYLNGHFNEAQPYLEIGYDISNKMKAGLLKSTADALLGICRVYQGDDTGLELIKGAERHARLTHQFHKKGMIDLLYLEGLLLTYDLNTFLEQVDKKIEFSERTKQLSFAAWMYFLKAIYFAFYNTSGPGYIGSIAKANMIAETLGLKALQNNIVSLTMLYQSNLYDTSPDNFSGAIFYDKATFFYRHSANVIPLYRH